MMYTNISNKNLYDYTDSKPYNTEGSVNFQELGMMAVAECRESANAIFKDIGIGELAYLESTGSPYIIYEASGISGIFAKIKMVFRKIIEKVKKIFHTFFAKMGSIFKNNKSFADKYGKEVIRKWANVSNDWSISGYLYTTTDLKESKADREDATKEAWQTIIEDKSVYTVIQPALSGVAGTFSELMTKLTSVAAVEDVIAKIKDNKEKIQDRIRGTWIPFESGFKPLDASEYTEELFKWFRNGEDSKIQVEKKDMNITAYINFVRDYETIKKNIDKSFKNFTSGVEGIIKSLDRDEKDYMNTVSSKDSSVSDDDKKIAAGIVQLYATCKNLLEFDKECGIQFQSAYLNAIKEETTFYKSIMVKVIGQSKKVTEESYDYSSQYSYDSGSSFMDSVQLV